MLNKSNMSTLEKVKSFKSISCEPSKLRGILVNLTFKVKKNNNNNLT